MSYGIYGTRSVPIRARIRELARKNKSTPEFGNLARIPEKFWRNSRIVFSQIQSLSTKKYMITVKKR